MCALTPRIGAPERIHAPAAPARTRHLNSPRLYLRMAGAVQMYVLNIDLGVCFRRACCRTGHDGTGYGVIPAHPHVTPPQTQFRMHRNVDACGLQCPPGCRLGPCRAQALLKPPPWLAGCLSRTTTIYRIQCLPHPPGDKHVPSRPCICAP